MTTATLPFTTVAIQSQTGSQRLGSLARNPIGSTKAMLARAPLDTIKAIPGAVVVSAHAQVWQRLPWSGSHTLTAQALTARFSTQTIYGTRPAATTTNQVTVTRPSPAQDSVWDFDVTAICAQWVSGSLTNAGLQFVTSDAPGSELRGSEASMLRPVLVVDYLVPGEAPTGLHPSGNVGVTKPTLQFQVPGDTTAIQVQVDPNANGTSPTFDSGTVTSSAGLLPLTGTYNGATYGGLTSGSTQWRARARNGLGWGAWSGWVTFSYVAKGTFTFTSPPTNSEDPSPPIAGTLSGANLKGWRAVTLDAAGVLLEDSGLSTGPIAFGPTKAYATAQVDVYDDVVRDSTPGDPEYLRSSRTITVAASGSVSPFSNVQVSGNVVDPVEVVTATRSQIPDEVALYRRVPGDTTLGTLVWRGPGTTYMTATALSLPDATVPMNAPVIWDVYAIVNGAWSVAASTGQVTPRCTGAWLINEANVAERVALVDLADAGQDRVELAVVHRPAAGGPVIRRRLGRGLREGSLDGFRFLDALGLLGRTSQATFFAWADRDAGSTYRFVLGNANLRVILGDLDTHEDPVNSANQFAVSIVGHWWAQ